jgi:pantoate--beta-alanine ligase
MKEIKSSKQFQQEMTRLREKGQTIGFVPTMGALHAGHMALVRAARKQNKLVVVSIFVNPTQFGPNEDLNHYPRPLFQDRKLLQEEKVDYLFLPESKTLYPEGFSSWVEVSEELTTKLCGAFRPGHFRGVTTIVAKLFNLVRPHRAYFGAKDYQQATVIRRMNQDLDFGIDIKVVPTVREKDGLAMSSRNAYLSLEERARALSISETLFWLRDEIKSGTQDFQTLKQTARIKLDQKVDRIDYLEIVDAETLETLTQPQSKMVVLTACFVGKTRLIDNVIPDAAIYVEGKIMQRQILNGKIHRATVTDAHIDYPGSITIDPKLLNAADIVPGEKVLVTNLTNGARIETYALPGKPGEGEICLNGGAAKHGKKGDLVIIMTFVVMTDDEIKNHRQKIVHVDARNQIV